MDGEGGRVERMVLGGRLNGLRAAVVALLALAALSCVAQTGAAPSISAHDALDEDVRTLHYAALQHDLAAVPAGAEHDLFAGVLANRKGQYEESLRLLTPLQEKSGFSVSRMALVLGALADDDVKLFRYADASGLYDRLFSSYSAGLSPELLKDDKDDEATLKLLLDAPAQTIAMEGPVDIATGSDPLGSFTAELTVHGVTAPWILDTGANFSAVSESFAKQLGVKASAGTAQTMGATGAENPLHVGVLDELRIGGATVHNVVLLILPDANLTIPLDKKKTYVIPAILGFPVFEAMGTIRFTHDHRFLAGPAVTVRDAAANIYMDKLSPLIECVTHDKTRVFLFDSGANASAFFVAYYREFAADFANGKKGKSRGYGAGGVATSNVYILDDTTLQMGDRAATLHHIAVKTTALGAISDLYEGSLGRDLLSGYESITLDFAHGHASLGVALK